MKCKWIAVFLLGVGIFSIVWGAYNYYRAFPDGIIYLSGITEEEDTVLSRIQTDNRSEALVLRAKNETTRGGTMTTIQLSNEEEEYLDRCFVFDPSYSLYSPFAILPSHENEVGILFEPIREGFMARDSGLGGGLHFLKVKTGQIMLDVPPDQGGVELINYNLYYLRGVAFFGFGVVTSCIGLGLYCIFIIASRKMNRTKIN